MTRARKRNNKRKRTDGSLEPEEAGSTSGAATTDPSSTPATTEVPVKKAKTFDERWKTATKSPEQVLEDQMDTWRSEVYEHFDMPPEIIYEDGVIKYRYWCRRHPAEYVTRARTDSSTSNLNGHVDVCDPPLPDDQSSIAEFASGSTYNKAKFRYLTTYWVATCYRPFAIVDDPPLQAMLKMLYAKVEVPSASTVSRDVKETFVISKAAVAAYLQGRSSAIHIAFDGWTAPNVISYLGVVVIYEEKGTIVCLLLDFVRLRKSHSGKYLAEKMHECLDAFGISDKIYGQTADNASNNDTMVEALGHRLNGPCGPHTRVRCLCHVMNLCVKAMLEPFMKAKKSKKKGAASADAEEADGAMEDDDEEGSAGSGTDDEDKDEEHADPQTPDGPDAEDDDDDELDQDREASDRATIDDILSSTEASVDLAGHERVFAQKTLSKVHCLTKKIFHSPVLREDLDALCRKHNIKSRGVVRSVPTRWNSVAMTSKRTIQLRPALDALTIKAAHNTSRGPRLLRFKLSPEEWEVLEQLEMMLGHFLEATERMSVRARPLLHEVIPMIDILEGMLGDTAANVRLYPAVRVAASLGQAVLNKYYQKTDDSVMYRCAILLHPRYKTAYFQRQNWPQSWIDTALHLLREEWKRYKPAVQSAGVLSGGTKGGLFAALDDAHSSSGTDALEEYLISPPLPSVGDPIKHWHSLDSERNPLARMALDILSTPATSVDAERSFSHGGLTVSKLRRNLSDESTRAATVLSAWMKVPGLVPEAKIINTFAKKSSRSKVQGAGAAGTSDNDAIVVE